MTRQADIVDTQIHIGPGGIAEALAQMNALGIKAALIDEYWFFRGATGENIALAANPNLTPPL